MKKIDLYIIRKFLGTFIYTIILIISIAVIFDFSEKLDDFIERQAPMRAIIFDYYMNFIPYYINLFSSLFTFLSVIYFTSRLSANYEIVAMLSSGISMRRIMVPYMISATIISVFSLILINYIIPNSNKVRLEFENMYYKNAVQYTDRNIHKQISPGLFIYMESYNNTVNLGYKFSMERFENGLMVEKLNSDYIRWDSTKQKWEINNYIIRTFSAAKISETANNSLTGLKETIKTGKKIDTTINLHPAVFKRRSNIIQSMNYHELNNFIKEQKMEGAGNIEASYIEKYKRFSYPFSTFILTLIGLSVAGRRSKGGIGMHIGLGLGLSAAYILFLQVSSQFAISGALSPLIAVWLPNVVFLIIGLVQYKFMPK